MAQTRLISDLVELVTPNNDDVFVVVDNTTNPSLSVTKRITYANLKEGLQDMIDLLVSGGTGINAAYNDGSNTLTLSVIADSTVQQTVVSSGGAIIGTRREVNFIPGAAVTLSGVDNPGGNRVDLTVNTTAVASGSNLAASGTVYNSLSSLDTLGNGTKELKFRPLKPGSSKTTIAYGDAGNSIVVDIDPAQININELSVTSPLQIAQGGTAATTASGARASLGAAKAGVNTDITAISGLTTALSLNQGGTAGNTAQAALKNLGGLKYITDVATVGESLVVNQAALVSNEYRGELKGVRAASSKIAVSTISNDIAIDVNADNVLNAATANVNFNSVRLTNVGAPISSDDVATKAYTDSIAQGLVVKEAVLAASTENLVGTYATSGQTLTLTATGTPSIDGLNITATGTRVLLKDQSTGSQNGIYALTTSGEAGVSAIFTRSDDFNSSAEADAGSFCFVLSGSTNGGKQFVQTVDNPTLDTTALVFTTLVDTTIPDDSVDNAKLANMGALTIKGAVTSGNPADLTADQVITIVNSGGTTQLDAARVDLSGYAALTGATFTGPIATPIGSTISGYAQFDTAQTFTKAQRGGVVALAGSGVVTPDFSLANNYSIALSGNVTLAFPSGVASGQSGAIRIEQGNNYVITYSGAWEFPGSTPPNNTTTSGASDLLVYYAHTDSGITAQLLTNVG
jgi:hypothetical protein